MKNIFITPGHVLAKEVADLVEIFASSKNDVLVTVKGKEIGEGKYICTVSEFSDSEESLEHCNHYVYAKEWLKEYVMLNNK